MIGELVARFRGEEAITRAHLVESEIEDRKITRCGRSMGERAGTELRVTKDAPVCKQCVPE